MFTKTLSQNAAVSLALLGKSGILKDAWEEVKRFFQEQSLRLARKKLQV